jgi:hypothetical protein
MPTDSKADQGQATVPKPEPTLDRDAAKQPNIYEILEFDISKLESQASGRDFKLGSKIVAHLKMIKRRVTPTHVAELEKFYFKDAGLAAKIEKFKDGGEVVVEKANFEKKDMYQPATLIYLKTVILTFFMKHKDHE